MDVERIESETHVGNGHTWWPLLLPCAYLLHLVEEWWGGEGFVRWTAQALGAQVSIFRFVVFNGVVWLLFAALTVVAIRKPAFSWFLTTFGTILIVNTALHALGSLTTGTYSPGLLTGLLLYLPIGIYTLVATSRQLRLSVFNGAVLGGILFHVLVAVIAFI